MAVKIVTTGAINLVDIITEAKDRGERILDVSPASMKFNRKTGEYDVTTYRVISQG